MNCKYAYSYNTKNGVIIDMILRILNRIKTLCLSPWYFIESYYYYFYIRKKLKSDEVCILISGLIGDAIYGLSYINAYHCINPHKKIILYCPSKFIYTIAQKYSGYDEAIIVKNSNKMFNIMRSNYWTKKGIKKNIINTIPKFYKDYANNIDNLTLLTKIFGLTEKAEIQFPAVNDRNIFILENEDLHNVIIINPYSNSCCVEIKLFESICSFLKQNGFKVYTNCIGSQKAIEGSCCLNCSLDELYYLSKRIRLVVSVRSGILDYIISTNVDMLVLYGHRKNHWQNLYSLSRWNREGKILEINVYYKKYNEIISELKNMLGIRSIL